MSAHASEHHPAEETHPAENYAEQHEGRHPSFKQYVYIALILFIITAVEFLLIAPWWDITISWQGSKGVVAPLFALSALKFAIVIMFYMHLKFDSRTFTVVFISGLVLALLVGMAVLGLFGSFQPTPRTFAACNAVPYVHHEPGEPAGEPLEVERGPECDVPGPAAAPAPAAAEPAAGGETATALEGAAADGQALFVGKGGCAACHTIEGVPGAVGLVGPNQSTVGAEAGARIPGYSAEEYLRESILDPDAYVVEGYAPGLMAPLVNAANLTDDEIDALVEFLLAQQ